MTAAEAIAENLAQVRARIQAACERSGRNPREVRLVAVSKLQPPEKLSAALAAGQLELGENYAQELRDKARALLEPRPRWHFLGALQSNKVKYVVGVAELVHTCDGLPLAEELDARARKLGQVQAVLIEINIDREPQKAGLLPEQLPDLLQRLGERPHLRVEGLMAIPRADGDARAAFRALRELRDRQRERANGLPLHELSMGMSADYEAAIEEGATLVRVGTAIFGARPPKG